MITRQMAYEFMRDLKGTIYGDCNHPDSGIMSAAHVAKLMKMDEAKVSDFLWVAVRNGYSDRQGGGFVV